MSETHLIVAGVEVFPSGRSAIATSLALSSCRQSVVPSSVFFPSLAATVRVTQLGGRAFENTGNTWVTIPCHVQILCSFCVSDCKSLSSISFETESELTRIESSAFYSCSLKSITIHRHVQILCSYCFSYCKSFSSISFETESELARIELYAFHCCSSLKSITTPHHGQILCSSCFSDYKSLSSISFETELELTRIEADVFATTCLSFAVASESVSFVAGDAFPVDCNVASAVGDSHVALRGWSERRQSGSNQAFERRT
jgi:hypothetical protein